VFLGGGAGMAPSWRCCARWPTRHRRKATFYYGARRRRDLCFEDELRKIEETLPNFRYVPALSEPDGADGADDWDGEVAWITDVLAATRNPLRRDAYVCGPPPMVEAALELLPAFWAWPTSASSTTSSTTNGRSE